MFNYGSNLRNHLQSKEETRNTFKGTLASSEAGRITNSGKEIRGRGREWCRGERARERRYRGRNGRRRSNQVGNNGRNGRRESGEEERLSNSEMFKLLLKSRLDFNGRLNSFRSRWARRPGGQCCVTGLLENVWHHLGFVPYGHLISPKFRQQCRFKPVKSIELIDKSFRFEYHLTWLQTGSAEMDESRGTARPSCRRLGGR